MIITYFPRQMTVLGFRLCLLKRVSSATDRVHQCAAEEQQDTIDERSVVPRPVSIRSVGSDTLV